MFLNFWRLALIAVAAVANWSPAGAEGRFAQVPSPNGTVRLHYEEEGSGPPLLLLHGYGTHAYTWRLLMPELARRYRVIALDFKGFGKSDKPIDTLYSAADQASLVEAFIRQLDLRDITVFGHSFGGGVALMLALNETKRGDSLIRRLVLLDTLAYPQRVPVFLKLLQTPGISDIGVRLAPSSVQVLFAMRIAYYDNGKIPPEAITAYAEPLKSPEAKNALVETARQLMPPNIHEIEQAYPSLKLPTLILWCDHDKVVPIEVGQRLAGTLPNARFQLITSCGHLPQEEQPEQTLWAVRSFLEGTRAAALGARP